MDNQSSRRNFLGQAGLMIGSAVALKSLVGCTDDDGTTDPGWDGADASCPPPPDASCPPPTDASCPAPTDGGTGVRVLDFPYESHLAADYRLDPDAVREAAYHLYYQGGCCHGAYRGLLEHLATTAGAPFDMLPLDFGKFGGGGIAGFGSICGAALGASLIINQIVADGAARGAMLTDLLRWYEEAAFPMFLPTEIDEAEHDLTKDFSETGIVHLQVIPGSHLCHASVSSWCSINGVSASGSDKKARCSRLTADVAGRAAEILNSYLETHSYTAPAMDPATATCLGCHTPDHTEVPVASKMTCGSCHDQDPATHP